MVDIESRYAGAVVGQALGDAAGFPVEGSSPAVCVDYVDTVLRSASAGALGRAGFPFGQYTDDTQLMRELLQGAVASGGYDPVAYGRRIAAIFTEGRIVGYGRATRDAAMRLAAGVPWSEAGAAPPAAGNGSAMRAAAVGLLAPRDPARLVAIAREQSAITHRDPRCAAGSVAIAAAVARGLRGEPAEPLGFCAELATLVEHDDALLADWIRRLPSLGSASDAAAAEAIGRLGAAPEVGDVWHGISPFVTPSVLWSLRCFLRYPDDYWGAVCAAIAGGGDADTTAAMTGAIAGAHLGLEALPGDLARRVNDQETWGYDELVELAVAVAALALAGPTR